MIRWFVLVKTKRVLPAKTREGARLALADKLSCFEASAMLFLVFSLFLFALWSLWQINWLSSLVVAVLLAYFLLIYAKKACSTCLQDNCPIKKIFSRD